MLAATVSIVIVPILAINFDSLLNLISLAIDIVYVLDAILRAFFFTMHVEKERRVSTSTAFHDIILSRRVLLWEYAHSHRFLFFVLSTLPLELLLGDTFRLNRLLRLWNVLRGIAPLRVILSKVFMINISRSAEFKWYWFAAVAIFLHWLSCAWMVFTKERAYLKALYWAAVTVTTTGFGDIIPNHGAQGGMQTAFVAIAVPLGVTLFAGIIATLTDMMHDARISRENAAFRKAIMEKMLTEQNIVGECRDDILSYLAAHEDTYGNMDPDAVLKDLPGHMGRKIRISILANVAEGKRLLFVNSNRHCSAFA